MADYYIKCTEKDQDGDIERVGYSRRLKSRVGSSRKDKSDVIRDIDVRGQDVMTAYKRNGRWTAGDEVHTVNGEYIRTDGNQIDADNLDKINEC